MKVFGIILTLLGAFLLYCSHSNQNIFAQFLPSIFKIIGLISILIGLIFLVFSLPKLVAILTWSMMLIFFWSFCPFVMLFKRKLVP